MEDPPSLSTSLYVTMSHTGEQLKSFFSSMKPILKNYGIACSLSGFAAFSSMLISYGASKLQYRIPNPTPKVYYSRSAFDQIVILFYVFGLLFFTVFQFYVFNGAKGLLDRMYISGVILVLSLFVVCPIIMTHFGFPYQLYLIDVLLIVVLFCGLTFMIGYFSKEKSVKHKEIMMSPAPLMVRVSSNLHDPAITTALQTTLEEFKQKTQRERIISGLYYLITEVLVSATALAYGMFFITIYSSMDDIGKIAWRLVLHPLYFEILMMLPVHYLVARRMKKEQDVNILYTLSVVHAQSHISTLGRMMFSTLDHVSLTVLSVLLLNVGKFFFRLSTPLRNSLVQKIMNMDVRETPQETIARLERQRYIVSAAIQTEMIVENSCAIFAGLTMYLFEANKQVFMFPYPKGELMLQTVIFIILVQLGFALVFDLTTLYVAQRFLHLPVLETWKDMWQRKYRFFGFLLYGLLTMGVVGIFYMGFKAPRVPFCTSESVCSCVWLKWMHTSCEQFLASAAL
eukprot:Phypoly_transcript_06122.p1 GENE.Phypoly_transcript_06122~~Phypoly_transcript_06122.p1  ORF type:complete len:512 (+),score=57.98 Phypoly_transcript_06122:231-1766(+)